MLNIFNRDRSYFQLLRDNGNYIESYNVDNQYNNIIDYLNNQVVSEINNIIGGGLPGIIGSPNTYLRNIGDGTTEWSSIDQGVNNYSLSFSKLVKSTVNSVLISNILGQMSSVSTNTANQLLVSQENDSPIWKQLQTKNISDRGITGIDIADNAIGAEHLKNDVIVTTIGDGMVRGTDFIDYSITANKFLNGSITVPKLGVIRCSLPQVQNLMAGNTIKRQHIKNGTLTIDKFKTASINQWHFNKVKSITRGKIAPNIIDDSWLKANTVSNINNLTYFFVSDNLAANFKLTSDKLRNGVSNTPNTNPSYLNLTNNNFASDVSQAFMAKGCQGYQP